MEVLVTGSTGLVGTSLVEALRAAGDKVRRLVRSRAQLRPGDAIWDPTRGELETGCLAGIGAAVHLAGENIAAGRWTAARKESIRRSRVGSTRLLSELLARMEPPPRVLVCASAVGFYGNRDDEVLTDESPPGTGFLAEVCREWESAARPAAERGIRVVHLRFGVILSGRGGALKEMARVFRLGFGGRLGNGKQYVSWISLPDAVGVVRHALSREDLGGPVSAVAPDAVTNAQLTRALAKALHRPAILPVPAFALRLAFGEMADEVLLSSQRVEPRKLIASGYAFRHRRLEAALVEALRGES